MRLTNTEAQFESHIENTEEFCILNYNHNIVLLHRALASDVWDSYGARAFLQENKFLYAVLEEIERFRLITVGELVKYPKTISHKDLSRACCLAAAKIETCFSIKELEFYNSNAGDDCVGFLMWEIFHFVIEDAAINYVGQRSWMQN